MSMTFNEFVKRLVAKPQPDGRRVLQPLAPFGPAYLVSERQCAVRGWLQLLLFVGWIVGMNWFPLEDSVLNILAYFVLCLAINTVISLLWSIGLPRTQVRITEDQKRAGLIEHGNRVGNGFRNMAIFMWILTVLDAAMYLYQGDWLSAVLGTAIFGGIAAALTWHHGLLRKARNGDPL